MARILLLSVDDNLTEYEPFKHFSVSALRASAGVDAFGIHQVTEDPEEADVILFAETGLCGLFAERVRVHPLYRKYPEKCFLFYWYDTARPVLPGLYASLRKQDYSPEHARTGFHLVPENPYVGYRPLTGRERYLAAFVGSANTYPLRKRLFEFSRPDIHLEDTSKDSYRIRYQGTLEEKEPYWKRYADSMADAMFSLCPRGHGSGTIRLYESMKMGRACIILSDEWVPNEGVDWESFSVRVPEADVAGVPDLLDGLRHRTKKMGEHARQEWEKWFSEKVRFHQVAKMCVEMKSMRKIHGRLRRCYHLRHILRPSNLRLYMISKKLLYQDHHRIFW
ncbi:MAG: exostosin family protein [Silvibacterium sp.]